MAWHMATPSILVDATMRKIHNLQNCGISSVLATDIPQSYAELFKITFIT